MNSMTGFGKGSFETATKNYTIELRSVNHRFIELKMRLPKGLLSIEDKIEKKIKCSFKRGTFSVYLDIRHISFKEEDLSVNLPLATAYFEAGKKVSQTLSIENDLSIQDILRYPEVLTQDSPKDDTLIWKPIEKALDLAIEQLKKMRSLEGAGLKTDFVERLEHVSKTLDAIENQSATVVVDYQVRLRERIEQLLDQVPVNEDRIAYEVAAFADKSNITEEIVRLRIHLKQFAEIVDSADGEGIGRKLDFLLQEMNREINTIGSKSNLASIGSSVVSIKSELEKIREQVQNIE